MTNSSTSFIKSNLDGQVQFNLQTTELEPLVISTNCGLFLENILRKQLDSRMKIYRECIIKLPTKQQEFTHALWNDGISPIHNALSKYVSQRDFQTSVSTNWEFDIKKETLHHYSPNYTFSTTDIANFSHWISEYLIESVKITAQELDEIILELENDELDSLKNKEYNQQSDDLKFLKKYLQMRIKIENNSELGKKFMVILAHFEVEKERNQEGKNLMGKIS